MKKIPEAVRHAERLAAALEKRAPLDAAARLARHDDDEVTATLPHLSPGFARQLVEHLPEARRDRFASQLPGASGGEWPADSVGRLMEAPLATFSPATTVGDARKALRHLARAARFTYAYCVDPDGRLRGVVVMRDLMFASRTAKLEDIMIEDPFVFRPETPIEDAAREVLARHYPVYPVCADDGRLVGLVHGYALFAAHTANVSATAGRMVGVQNEEHFATHWTQSLKLRHPWLQLNLLTAFLAAAVVGVFEETIARVVMLAVFLPVLAGQSGNTGCQALAVTLRAMALDEMPTGEERQALLKEAWLGLLNGALVGITAGIAMFLYAGWQNEANALLLGLVVAIAMTGSCVLSGLTGVLVPLTLRRFGTDPATASSIFVTTATDVASMGLLLGLATWLVR
ncbi:MAG TPA: magnesium transporter [Gammaproteobacteria bacterium]